MSITVLRATGGRWRANSYLVVHPGGDALLIDPGAGTAELVAHAREAGLRVAAILATHGHFDHVEGVALARRELGAPFLLHSGDVTLARSANLYRALFAADAPVAAPEIDGRLDDAPGPRRFGALSVVAHHVPGHTAGSVALAVDGLLFTGDTLLPGSVGRTDLPGGDAVALRTSLAALVALAPHHRLLPGHRDETTLEEELRSNGRLADALATTAGGPAR